MDSKEITEEIWKIVDGLLCDAYMAGVNGAESMDLIFMKARFTSAFEYSMEQLFKGQKKVHAVTAETGAAAKLGR